MLTVLVNGNPETGAVWDPLVKELAGRDVRRLSPPGFGAPVPDGFTCSITGYRDWLVAELAAIGESVNLVGHDIGGSTVLTVAMARPDLLHTWASDSLGVFDPDYVWHGLAQGWQTPEVGEASVADLMGGTLVERTKRMMDRGFSEKIAREVAGAQGPQMARAILEFYRSATQPVMKDLGKNLPDAAERPGLALLGTADSFVGSTTMRHRAAARAGASVATLDGLGHWWMVQDPSQSARALTAFWAANG